jgi:hypothetical protein
MLPCETLGWNFPFKVPTFSASTAPAWTSTTRIHHNDEKFSFVERAIRSDSS